MQAQVRLSRYMYASAFNTMKFLTIYHTIQQKQCILLSQSGLECVFPLSCDLLSVGHLQDRFSLRKHVSVRNIKGGIGGTSRWHLDHKHPSDAFHQSSAWWLLHFRSKLDLNQFHLDPKARRIRLKMLPFKEILYSVCAFCSKWKLLCEQGQEVLSFRLCMSQSLDLWSQLGQISRHHSGLFLFLCNSITFGFAMHSACSK